MTFGELCGWIGCGLLWLFIQILERLPLVNDGLLDLIPQFLLSSGIGALIALLFGLANFTCHYYISPIIQTSTRADLQQTWASSFSKWAETGTNRFRYLPFGVLVGLNATFVLIFLCTAPFNRLPNTWLEKTPGAENILGFYIVNIGCDILIGPFVVYMNHTPFRDIIVKAIDRSCFIQTSACILRSIVLLSYMFRRQQLAKMLQFTPETLDFELDIPADKPGEDFNPQDPRKFVQAMFVYSLATIFGFLYTGVMIFAARLNVNGDTDLGIVRLLVGYTLLGVLVLGVAFSSIATIFMLYLILSSWCEGKAVTTREGMRRLRRTCVLVSKRISPFVPTMFAIRTPVALIGRCGRRSSDWTANIVRHTWSLLRKRLRSLGQVWQSRNQSTGVLLENSMAL
jgi:hypothetical protein